MRLFQCGSFGKYYLNYFNSTSASSSASTFAERLRGILDDRYEATHILKPIYENDPHTFFTVADDELLQRRWAEENGLKSNDPTDIVLAQIENFGADIVYQLDPVGFPSEFVKRLPSCVKKTIAWRAAPLGGADISAYDLILSNFPHFNDLWRRAGVRSEYFSPAWDPSMKPFAEAAERPVDMFFTGSYARTTGHDDRLDMLEAVIARGSWACDIRLRANYWGRLIDKPLLRWVPFPTNVPRRIRRVSKSPIYGKQMYRAISRSKIVLNPATSITGKFRGNMRCWEAMGCGAVMLGTEGEYPDGFIDGKNYVSYKAVPELFEKVAWLLSDVSTRLRIAREGEEMIRRRWGKDNQWNDFLEIAAKA